MGKDLTDLAKADQLLLQIVAINNNHDLSQVTIQAYSIADHIGFSKSQRTMIATAASELAHNIINYAKHGTITIKQIQIGDKQGIEIMAVDNGPGIKDIKLALQDEYSTGGSLGLGLPGSKRLMDEFYFDANRQSGTKIVLRRWL